MEAVAFSCRDLHTATHTLTNTYAINIACIEWGKQKKVIYVFMFSNLHFQH